MELYPVKVDQFSDTGMPHKHVMWLYVALYVAPNKSWSSDVAQRVARGYILGGSPIVNPKK